MRPRSPPLLPLLNLTAARSLHQHLLEGGLGREFLLAGASQTSLLVKGILANLEQEADFGAQLEGLTQLCDLLSVSSEDALLMFPVERVVPLLVHVLQRDEGPELMLLATRAIAYMVDSVPHAGRACVTHGAIPSLCEKLLTIEYIDLAEQSLQALEKLSVEFPDALVRGGGLMAALSYLDFFPTGFQRAALKTAKHMTRQLRPEHADLALDAVPLLINTVHHPDGKVSGLAGRGLGRERRRGRPSGTAVPGC